MRRHLGYRFLLSMTLVAGIVVRAAAQQPEGWDPNRLQVTRASLKELLARFEEAQRSGAYSPELKERARYEASLIQARLEEGDFQVGDEVELVVEGEQQLTDTFPVLPGRQITLPMIGAIALKGVLRSELEPYMTEQLKRFIREPVVHARSLIRVLVSGQISQPGFYVVPAEEILSNAIMAAGGPTQTAKLTDMRIERADHTIWEGPALRQAVAEGRTLDQLSLRAGDQIVVPEEKRHDAWEVVRIGLITIPPLIFGLTRVF